ncbi:MAG TPA: ribosome biogenesis GTPase Der, partial [Chloroflexota bacterium]|nr:ribosome biogenesis GTPase Der [Chloroflexota bacterium]
AREGPSAIDYDVAELLRRSDKPVILVANKADNPERMRNAVEYYQLGMGEPMAISSVHGHGTGDLLDEIVKDFPEGEAEEPGEEVRLAIVGRPNVGKSSLVNAIAGQSRSMVSDIPGTTRDVIDTVVQYLGKSILLVDTAGIRKRGKVEQGIEKYSVIRAVQAVERSDVAALIIDASEGLTAQDTHVAGYILDAAKGMMVVANKWDLVTKSPTIMQEYTVALRQALKFADYVPIIFTSALTKQRVPKLLDTALQIAQEREKRIPTAALNDAMQEAFVHHSPPVSRGRALKLLYVTQADVKPPTFVFFVNDPRLLHFSYQRYLENEIRSRWSFTGTPIRMVFKPRSVRE